MRTELAREGRAAQVVCGGKRFAGASLGCHEAWVSPIRLRFGACREDIRRAHMDPPPSESDGAADARCEPGLFSGCGTGGLAGITLGLTPGSCFEGRGSHQLRNVFGLSSAVPGPRDEQCARG